MRNKVETFKEIRLWITQIITPAIIVGTIVITSDSGKSAIKTVKRKINNVKRSFVNKLRKRNKGC
jgi:C4-type Zn-finger protein